MQVKFLAAALAALGLLCSIATASADSDIEIHAVPSTFTPNVVKVHAGVVSHLKFTGTEGVHEIESSELGIPATTLAPGKDVVVDVKPAKPGTYVLHCEIVCGEDHDKMALTIVVE